MNKMRDISLQYKSEIEKNYEDNAKGAEIMHGALERTPLYYKNMCAAQILQIPKVYTMDVVEDFKNIVKTSYGIFKKVILEYLNCEDYRRLFPFSEELEELILVPSLYDSLLPIARFDIFYNEDNGSFHFCEVNTDGTSAMNEDRILDEVFINNPAHQAVIRKYRLKSFELFESWIDTFMKLYNSYEKKKENPNVAVVDFLDKGTVREFEEFARRFQRRGINCEICDIRELIYKHGKLYSKRGNVVDAIYRRAVTSDIMSHYDEVQPFIMAVREQNVFLAGSFMTQIIHNKWLFNVLWMDRTMRILTEAERRFVKDHIPKTVMFSGEYIDKDEVIKNKDKYILKPVDSYASNGVFAGVEYSHDEWKCHVDEVYGKEYICQEYCPQYETENIDFIYGGGKFRPYINMTGLYVYNGQFAGVYSRLSDGGIIASHRNERTVPSYYVE